ncbi:MAG: endo-beta-N-acetylglucosaminidase [Calditrichia bacterium]
MKLLRPLAILVLLLSLAVSQTSKPDVSIYKTKSAFLPVDQPFTSYWFPNELLAWTPGSDADAPYNRANTRLRDRAAYNISTQVNSNARPNEAEVNNLPIFWATSGNPSQGGLDVNYYSYNYWQYLDVLVFWGGSAGEGLILAPNPGIVDAAHRNGVPVLGTIFFPPVVFGGQIQWVQDLLQRSGNTFPVADKLIEVAEYYGFDGWFINQETTGGNAILAADMREFMLYFQRNSNLQLQWYDAMTESGAISWQEQLNSNNDMFFQYSDTVVSEYMFLDFGWTASDLTTTRTNANNLNRSEFDLYAGIDVQANGYNTGVNWASLFPAGQAQRTSVGFYVPSWTYSSASNVADFYTRDNRFWVGANRDPSNTTTTSNWKGLANYIPAKSAATELPFVTNFNTGHGFDYYIDGEKGSPDSWSTTGWNNISLQDILPTWRWVITSTGTPLYPEMDWTDAYYGGNSIKISGDLQSENNLRLYKTELDLTADSRLDIAYKTAAGPTALSIGLRFEDLPLFEEFIALGSATTSDWEMQTLDLSGQAGRKLIEISLRFDAAGINSYDMRLGRLAVYDVNASAPAPASMVSVERKVEESPSEATLRLRWTGSSDEVYYYNIFRVNPDNSRTFLGGTANTAYFVPSVERVGDESTVTLEVIAVGLDFQNATPATTTFTWDVSQQPTVATNPIPGDGETDVTTGIDLNWTAGMGALTHDVYLGTTNPPPFVSNEATTMYDPGVLMPGTVYYWRIDEVNTVGTATGTVWSFTTDNMVVDTTGNALFFDNDYLDLGNDASLQITGQGITLEAWIKASSWQPNVWQGSIMNKEQQGPGNDSGYMLRAGNNGQLNFNLGSGSWNELNSAVGLMQTEVWYHVAGSYNGSEMKIFINGAEVGSTNAGFNLRNSTFDLQVGSSEVSADRNFLGTIDEVRVWNVGRTQEQIQRTMSGQLDPVYYTTADSGLVGYWQFNEGSGQITSDLSVYGNDGTLGSTPGVDAKDPMWVDPAPLVGIEDGLSIPSGYVLEQNYPNPFNPATTIAYSLPQNGQVTIAVYNLLGQRVRLLVDLKQTAGSYQVVWDGRNDAGVSQSSGIYLYRLSGENTQQTQKMILMK